MVDEESDTDVTLSESKSEKEYVDARELGRELSGEDGGSGEETGETTTGGELRDDGKQNEGE